jgi:ribonucleoside-diphosphate reductase subunit M2
MSPDQSKNYCLFPIPQNERSLYDLYKKSIRVFWVAEEVDYTGKDKDDWIKLTDNEQYFIKNILAFFAGSDGIVSENLYDYGKFLKLLL